VNAPEPSRQEVRNFIAFAMNEFRVFDLQATLPELIATAMQTPKEAQLAKPRL